MAPGVAALQLLRPVRASGSRASPAGSRFPRLLPAPTRHGFKPAGHAAEASPPRLPASTGFPSGPAPPGPVCEALRTPPGRPLRTRGRAISAAHWPRARPAPSSRPSQHPGLPTASGEVPSLREPGAGSAGAGRRAEVSAAAAGPAVVGCARAGRALVGCGPRGWAAGSGLGSGLGRRPGFRCARSAPLRVGCWRRRRGGRGRGRG